MIEANEKEGLFQIFWPENLRDASVIRADLRANIEQILLEAQHRWLRPAEICEILQNYKKFRIAPEPPNRPPSGSLFLFDRKVLRYFRKDGHNWRKKRDGKTVKEAHERLKAGSVDVLHCYYAHGEENENFQRRSYWMLEEELSHIVLVHYREGNRTNFNRIRNADVIPDSRQTEESISNSEVDSSARFQPYDYQGASQATDTSLNSTHASEHEDAESAYRQQASSGFQSIHELQTPQKTQVGSVPCYPVPISMIRTTKNENTERIYNIRVPLSREVASLLKYSMVLFYISNMYYYDRYVSRTIFSYSWYEFWISHTWRKNKDPMDNGLTYQLHGELEFPSWGNVVESSNAGYQSVNFQPSHPSTQSSAMSLMPGQENELLDQIFTGVLGKKQNFGSHSGGLEEWQAPGRDSLNISKWSMDQKSDDNQNLGQNSNYPSVRPPLLFDLTTKLDGANQVELCHSVELDDAYLTEHSRHPMQNDLRLQSLTAVGSSLKLQSDGNPKIDDKTSYPTFRQPLLDGIMGEGLRKLDSFDRWMSKELGDVTESNVQPGSGAYWETVGSEDGDDTGISTQMPLDNFILGPSLSQDQLFSIIDFSPNWAYSGSEIKQASDERHAFFFAHDQRFVADGVLRCHTPSHATGRVPFYITCSNRLACSEVREFEFRTSSIQDVDLADVGSITSDETLLHMRFGKLLSLGSGNSQTSEESNAAEISKLRSKISALLKDDSEWEQMLNLTKQDEFSADKVKDQLLQKLLKEKLHVWLLQKVAEGGKGPNVLDEGGQGVLQGCTLVVV
ncbi:UNVERIFIED_CONTAM: Calmodulin-binding transcription activator 3 [Sesamum calycinum]|uniref:Calmodulin-binding transcription activator 3 n=1 Tax=Sesamum calycinum TaxID=2727403 RepID=A0AAW2SWG4_9LAMI